MKTWITAAAAAACFAVISSTAFAQASPVGLWKTIDDETKQERSLVRITDAGGVLTGKIEKISDASKAGATCDQCEGAQKDKPVLGMAIINGVKKAANDEQWDGGTIVDPNNGKSYKVRLTLKDGGKTMEVRGFIGFLYRNQTWQRVE
jgi:uncharacterized protein (DUF2147 family)